MNRSILAAVANIVTIELRFLYDLGVIATYYLEPKGDPTYIFTGVAILFVAVIMNTIASTYAHRYVS